MTERTDDTLAGLDEACKKYLAAKTQPERIKAARDVNRATGRVWRAVKGDAGTFELGLAAKPKAAPRKKAATTNGKEK